SCDGFILNETALAYGDGGVRDVAAGGTHGSPKDVAAAIYQAVVTGKSVGGIPNVVINLSVGWEPQWASGFVDTKRSAFGTLRAATTAVYEAIRFASCRGALVVAAAGNTGIGKTGPMYPAAWELQPAPGLANTECDDVPAQDRQPAGVFLVSV